MTSVYIDELKVGMSAQTERIVSEQDVQLFGQATGDINPVHFDDTFARKTVFRGRVAHGALSVGFISALLGTKLPGDGSIILDASIVFKAPVRIGEKVLTTVTVQKIEGRQVVFDCNCKVAGHLIVEAQARVLAPRRPMSK